MAEAELMGLPIPRYRVGDRVWHATSQRSEERYPCPDCKATGKWSALSPLGNTYEMRCPRCDGRAHLGRWSYRGDVRELTIGSIRIDTHANQSWHDNEPVQYMCVETGVGSGQIYNERALFPAEDQARAAAQLLANAALEAWLEEDKNRRAWDLNIRISDYEIRDARVETAEDATRALEQRLLNLLDRIAQLDELDEQVVAAGAIAEMRSFLLRNDEAARKYVEDLLEDAG